MQDNPDTREYFDNIDNALNKIKDIQGDDKILSDSQKDAIDEQWDIINDNLKDISNTMADSSDTAEDFVKMCQTSLEQTILQEIFKVL